MADEPKIPDTTQTLHDNTDGTPPKPADAPLGDVSPAKPSVSDGNAALDGLLKAAGGDPSNPEAGLKPTGDKTDDDTPPPANDQKEIADKEAAAAKKAKEGTPGDKPADEPPAPPVEPDDEYAKIKLPPHSKPASTEAFNAVKAAARAKEAKLIAELEETKKKVPTDGSAITPELKKEIEELKAFRAAHDYQNTPEFVAAHVTPIQANNELILSKLKAAGFADAHIEKIKQIGIDKLDWDPVLKDLPTITKRAIEAKLLENETLSEKKAAAIAAAQKAPGEFIAKQTEASKQAAVKAEQETQAEVDAVVNKVAWAKPKDIPPSATAAERTEIEGFNKFVKEQNDRKTLMLADNSPKMRGTLISAALLAYQFLGERAIWEKRATEAEAELARIKKSSSTQRRQSNAPATSTAPAKTSDLRSGRDAFADLEKEIAQRE